MVKCDGDVPFQERDTCKSMTASDGDNGFTAWTVANTTSSARLKASSKLEILHRQAQATELGTPTSAAPATIPATACHLDNSAPFLSCELTNNVRVERCLWIVNPCITLALETQAAVDQGVLSGLWRDTSNHAVDVSQLMDQGCEHGPSPQPASGFRDRYLVAAGKVRYPEVNQSRMIIYPNSSVIEKIGQ
jgi:hypothetical protein